MLNKDPFDHIEMLNKIPLLSIFAVYRPYKRQRENTQRHTTKLISSQSGSTFILNLNLPADCLIAQEMSLLLSKISITMLASLSFIYSVILVPGVDI